MLPKLNISWVPGVKLDTTHFIQGLSVKMIVGQGHQQLLSRRKLLLVTKYFQTSVLTFIKFWQNKLQSTEWTHKLSFSYV